MEAVVTGFNDKSGGDGDEFPVDPPIETAPPTTSPPTSPPTFPPVNSSIKGPAFSGMANDTCDIDKDSLPMDQRVLFQPEGYDDYTFAWSEVFGDFGYWDSFGHTFDYPKTPGPLTLLGSYTLKRDGACQSEPCYTIPYTGTRPTMKNKYISIAFEETQRSIPATINWIKSGGVTNTHIPYVGTAPYRMYVTISPCLGDFRYTRHNKTVDERQLGDATYTNACRKLSANSAVTMSNDISQLGYCTLTPGKRYYMNVVFADPSDGYISVDDPNQNVQPVENTCDTTFGFLGACEGRFAK